MFGRFNTIALSSQILGKEPQGISVKIMTKRHLVLLKGVYNVIPLCNHSFKLRYSPKVGYLLIFYFLPSSNIYNTRFEDEVNVERY